MILQFPDDSLLEVVRPANVKPSVTGLFFSLGLTHALTLVPFPAIAVILALTLALARTFAFVFTWALALVFARTCALSRICAFGRAFLLVFGLARALATDFLAFLLHCIGFPPFDLR